MSADFPQWWSEPDGEPIAIPSADLIPSGWVRRYGRYDVQIGQFVPDPDEPPIACEKARNDPFDHDGDGRPGGAPKGGNKKRKAK